MFIYILYYLKLHTRDFVGSCKNKSPESATCRNGSTMYEGGKKLGNPLPKLTGLYFASSTVNSFLFQLGHFIIKFLNNSQEMLTHEYISFIHDTFVKVQ